jgi:hypothetical protein
VLDAVAWLASVGASLTLCIRDLLHLSMYLSITLKQLPQPPRASSSSCIRHCDKTHSSNSLIRLVPLQQLH